MTELALIAERKGIGTHLIEICGGHARASQVAVRRNLKTGPNFDLITMVDLTERRHQEGTMNYIDAREVLVAVMAPVYDPIGPLGKLNKHIHPDSWQRSYDGVALFAILCGRVALTQPRNIRHFIQEQPHPTKLYEEHHWPEVLSTKGVVQQIYDRCTCGLLITRCQYKMSLH